MEVISLHDFHASHYFHESQIHTAFMEQVALEGMAASMDANSANRIFNLHESEKTLSWK